MSPRKLSIKLAGLCVLATALFCVAGVTSASAAFNVTNMTVDPSSVESEGNPDLVLAFERTGTESEDLATTVLRLPVGMKYSLAPVHVCSDSLFAVQNCPNGSQVGWVTARVKASQGAATVFDGLATGTVYRVSNGIGMTFRPSGVNPINVRHVMSGSSTSGIQLTATWPTIGATGVIPVELTFGRITTVLESHSPIWQQSVLLTNPAACGDATTELTATSTQSDVANASSTYSVPNCPPSTTITQFARPSVGAPSQGTLPLVEFTSPANGAIVSATTQSVSFTVDGSNTLPLGMACKYSLNGAAFKLTSVADPTATTFTVSLISGGNTISVRCKDARGPKTASIVVYRSATTPAAPPAASQPPSPDSAAPAVSFSGANQASFECRVDSEAFAPCTSPWTIPTAALTDIADHSYEVRAKNGAVVDPTPAKGHFFKDNRPFDLSLSATPFGNSLVSSSTAAKANDAGVSPDLLLTAAVKGWDDLRALSVTAPDGLMLSMASVPESQQCTYDQASSGDCPASSLIGTATASLTVASHGAVTATGNIYLESPEGWATTEMAGVFVEFENIGGVANPILGDIRLHGGLRLQEQGRTMRLSFGSVPSATTASQSFHLRSLSLSLDGERRPDPQSDPSAENPALVTNPHSCATYPSRPYKNKFYSVGSGHGGSAVTMFEPGAAAYEVDNCAGLSAAVAADFTVDNHQAGEPTPLRMSVSVPYGQSSTRAVQVKFPPWVSLETRGWGDSADMCDSELKKNLAPPGTAPGFLYFDTQDPQRFPCPITAMIGAAQIDSPIFSKPIRGEVYFIDDSPTTAFGVRFETLVHDSNPTGVQFGLATGGWTLFSELPDGTSCTIGIDDDCFDRLGFSFSNLPDIPIASITLEFGTIPGRAGIGSVTSDQIFKVAQPGDSSCQSNLPEVSKFTSIVWPHSGVASTTMQDVELPIGCNQ